MFWRFGEPSDDSDGPLFVFNDVCHELRYGDGPLIRLPRNPALILALLLQMQRANRTVSSDQIRNFLRLDERARVKDHVSELRKKLAEAGGDPTRILEHVGGQTGYRFSPGVRAGMVLEADALELLDDLIANPGPASPELKTGLLNLRSMLAFVPYASPFVSLFALGLAAWLAFRPSERPPSGTDEGGELGPVVAARTLIPAEGVHAFVTPDGGGTVTPEGTGYAVTLAQPTTSACFELPQAVKLAVHSTLRLDLGASSGRKDTKLDISLESSRADEPRTVVTRDLRDHAGPTTVRIPASDLAPAVKSQLRRVCLSAPGSTGEGDHAAAVFELIGLKLGRE